MAGRKDSGTPKYKNPSLTIKTRVNDLLSRMTLDEKVGQLDQTFMGWKAFVKANGEITLSEEFKQLAAKGAIGHLYGLQRADGWTGRNLKTGLTPREGARAANLVQKFMMEQTRLGIPLLLSEECPKGHMALGATVFPTPICYASSFDPAMLRKMAGIIALETRAEGCNVGYGPILDIPHDPRWSRVEEQTGEDPYLAGQIGAAMVQGYQGETLDDLKSDHTIAATLKHFAGFGTTEGGRHGAPCNYGPRSMRNMFLPSFEAAVKAGAQSVMNSYNDIDGVPTACSEWLLTEVLRNEWGFDGFVVSDAMSLDELHTWHAVAKDLEEAAAMAVAAGVDVNLLDTCFALLADAVRKGKLDEKYIDQAVRRVLTVKFRLGLFENPYADEERAERVVGAAEHREFAAEVARRSMILLKNEGHLLPLAKNAGSIAVIGPNADNIYNQIGNYTAPQPTGSGTTVLAGIRAKAAPGVAVRYAKGCGVKNPSTEGFAEAVAAAQASDLAIVVVGGSSVQDESVAITGTGTAVISPESALSDIDCGEGFDRSSLELSGVQMDLVKAIHATGKPMVVVLVQGRPHSIPWIAEHVPAILCAWYPGMEGGRAVADVLFGDCNPAGRLTISVPRSVGQVPVNYNHKSKAERKYVDCPADPQFPFGYGLSYTTFGYGNLTVSPAAIAAGGSAEVKVNVTNTGKVAGEEVVQLYVRDDITSAARPVKELKGFGRIPLQPGETKTVRFTLDESALSFYNRQMERVVEPGTFTIMVGGNSRDVLSAKLEVK